MTRSTAGRHRGRKSRRVILENRRQRLRAGLAPEGRRARQHLADHDAQREDIRAGIDRLTAHLLGRHVSNGAEQHAGAGQLCCGHRRLRRIGARGVVVHVDKLGEPEVENLDAAVPREKQVLWFQVAVDDALRVSGGKSLRDLLRPFESLSLRDCAGLDQARAQGLAVEQLRHDERHASLMADVVDDEDVGMIERPGCSRFGLEAPQTGVVGDGRLGQHLDGHVATEPRVARAIHNAHPSRVEQAHDLIGPEAGSRHDGGGFVHRDTEGITSGSLARHALQLRQPVEHKRDRTAPCVAHGTHQRQGLAIGMDVIVVVERRCERLEHQPPRQHANA